MGKYIYSVSYHTGAFSRVEGGIVVSDSGASGSSAWGDYNNDGFIDLFVANTGMNKNYLYHNNGDGSFLKITAGSVAEEIGNSQSCSWADFDNDNLPELLWRVVFISTG